MYRHRTHTTLLAIATATMFATGCGGNRPVKVEGSRDLVLSLTLDLSAITTEMESRLPNQQKQDPRFQQVIGQFKKLGVNRAEVHLIEP